MSEAIKVSSRRLMASGALVALLALTQAGCSSLYKVKPAVEAPIAAGARGAEAGGVGVRAVALLKDEESQALFEANLPLAGLLPVKVEISNNSNIPIEFKRVRFRLRDDAGRVWQARTSKQVAGRILKAEDVTLYNPNARKSFEEALSRHMLDLAAPLASNEHRQGLIFFQTPKKEAVASPRGLVLTIEGLPQPLELRLN
jgi:hypothetical protein